MSSSTRETRASPVKDIEDEETAPLLGNATIQDEQVFQIAESRKIGVTGAVFLILNKMIGTGSMASFLFLSRPV
jgi:hypothetical protein